MCDFDLFFFSVMSFGQLDWKCLRIAHIFIQPFNFIWHLILTLPVNIYIWPVQCIMGKIFIYIYMPNLFKLFWDKRTKLKSWFKLIVTCKACRSERLRLKQVALDTTACWFYFSNTLQHKHPHSTKIPFLFDTFQCILQVSNSVNITWLVT